MIEMSKMYTQRVYIITSIISRTLSTGATEGLRSRRITCGAQEWQRQVDLCGAPTSSTSAPQVAAQLTSS